MLPWDISDPLLEPADALTNLTGAHLTNAILYKADLSGSDLTNAILLHCDLTEANLTDAKLSGTDLTGVQGLNLGRA